MSFNFLNEQLTLISAGYDIAFVCWKCRWTPTNHQV